MGPDGKGVATGSTSLQQLHICGTQDASLLHAIRIFQMVHS
jgi:hypothetical protein